MDYTGMNQGFMHDEIVTCRDLGKVSFERSVGCFQNVPTRARDSFPNVSTRARDSFSNVPIRERLDTC